MNNFNVLSLDGGGSKGVYTLGVLAEIEALLGKPVYTEFPLIYGTSTGSIIAALIALGKTIPEIKQHYFEIIPKVMKHRRKKKRTIALRSAAEAIFSNLNFDAFKTSIGIVSTHIDYARPMIFKSSVTQAHGRASTFEPGFGVTIADAVLSSCSAFPFFEKSQVSTANQGSPLLLDGGFVANNPSLFAIADAIGAYKIPIIQIKLLSVGVGIYREPSHNFLHRTFLNLWPFWLIRKILDSNTNTMDILRKILLPDVDCVRINDTFAERDYETDLLESDTTKLEKLYQLGRESFARNEAKISKLMEVKK